MYTAAGKPPFTPGFEVSGIVESVGSGVTGLSPGSRVVALIRFGGYATAVNVDRKYVRHLEEGWSFAEGAAFAVQALTAYYAIVVLGGLLPKDWARRPGEVFFGEDGGNVLIQSLAGGVGLIAADLVQKCGGTVVGTVGREEKVKIAKERLGIPRERIIVREKDKGNFHDLITEKALGEGKGYDVVLDSVAGKYFAPAYKALNVGGRYVILGCASMMPPQSLRLNTLAGLWGWIKLGCQLLLRPKVDPMKMISENKTVSGFNLVWLYEQKEVVQLWDEILQLKLATPLVGKEYDFKDAKEALKFFQSGESVGKVCLTVPADFSL